MFLAISLVFCKFIASAQLFRGAIDIYPRDVLISIQFNGTIWQQ